MIDPMATGTVKRPSADLRRPRGREALSTHPPAPVDDTPRGSLQQRVENTWAPAIPLPLEAFSDEEASPRHFERLREPDAGTGRHAVAVTPADHERLRRLETAPTTGEVYNTVRAEHPTRRQRAIVDMWEREATFYELLEAWAQRAYTDRQLVRALHLAVFDCADRIREINQCARKY